MKLNELQVIGDKKELKNLKVSLLTPSFNLEFCKQLEKNVTEELIEAGIKKLNIKIFKISGSLESPYAAQLISKSKNKPDVIIALGVIIRGETTHYDLVSEISYQGLMKVQLENEVPIIFGILTCEDEKQAKDRISRKKLNKARDFAISAINQASLKKQIN